MAKQLPYVLIVDDHETEASVTELISALEGVAEAKSRHPQTVRVENLEDADLVLVDFVLDDWDELSGAVPAMAPRDGLALASVLRSQLGEPGEQKRVPTLFALHSAQVNKLSRGMPDEVREWAVARLHDLEWVFAKVEHTGDRDTYTTLAHRVASLARMRRLLPERWPQDAATAEADFRRILNLNQDLDWSAAAWRDISAAHPPLYELAESSHSLALVHWLAHRILPYPCFLWDVNYLAARLQLDRRTLADIIEDDGNKLTAKLNEHAYTGALHDFLGRRWWRAGVESLVWTVTEGALDIARLHVALSDLADHELTFSAPGELVCIDETFRPVPERSNATDAVRVQPDDWPPYADAAWVPISLANSNDRIRARVIPDDQDLLTQDDDSDA